MYFSLFSFEFIIIWLLELEAHSDSHAVSLQYFLGSGAVFQQGALRVWLILFCL